jgi:hypothetical protein
MNRGIKICFLILFCLSSSFFFYPIWISPSVLYYIYYAVFSMIFLLIILNIKKYHPNVFTTPVMMLIIAMLISAFSATFFWSQNILDSFIALLPNLSYILFFFLIIFNVRTNDIEKVFIFMGALYIILYSIAYITFPVQIFGYGHGDFGSDRGFRRILLNGLNYLFLFSFYSLNQYFNKHKLIWLIIYFISFVAIIMTLTRTMIMLSFILSVWYVLRKTNFFYKLFAVLFIGIFSILITQTNFSQIMIQQTKTHTQNFNDYIRVRAADFYINDFSPNLIAKIIGNGQPGGGSRYAYHVIAMERGFGYYLSDIGYVGLYTKFGLLAVIGFILIIIKTIKIPVPEEYLYSKYSLYFIFAVSIVGDSPYNSGAVPVTVLLMYVLFSSDLSKKIQSNNAPAVNHNS